MSDLCWITHFNFFFSGLTLYGDYRVQEVNEVTTSSNSVLLHFYSDLAYNMSGFNISYR